MSEFRGHQEIVKYHVAVLNIGDPWEGIEILVASCRSILSFCLRAPGLDDNIKDNFSGIIVSSEAKVLHSSVIEKKAMMSLHIPSENAHKVDGYVNGKGLESHARGGKSFCKKKKTQSCDVLLCGPISEGKWVLRRGFSANN